MKRYIEKIEAMLPENGLDIDEGSYLQAEGLRVIQGQVQGEAALIVDGARAFRYQGEIFGGQSGIRVCPLTDENLDRLGIDFPGVSIIQRLDQPLEEHKES